MKANLKQIAEDMDLDFEGVLMFFDKKSGKVVSFTEEAYRHAEDPEEASSRLQDWEEEEREQAKLVLEEPDRFVELPDREEIDEYKMMEDFSYSREGKEKDALLDAIRGRGAFRRFKDKAFQLGIVQEWYAYKDEAYRAIAREWCEEHSIPYE